MRTSLSLYLYLISGGEVVKPKHNQRGREGVKELVFFGNKSLTGDPSARQYIWDSKSHFLKFGLARFRQN